MSADLRRPHLHSYYLDSGFTTGFTKSGGAGLAEVLRGQRNLVEVLSTTGTENLWILRAGITSDSSVPSELLSSRSMVDLMAEAA